VRKDKQGTKGSRGSTCSALTDPQALSMWADEISQENFSVLYGFVGKGSGRFLAKELGWKWKGQHSSNCCWYCLLAVAVTSPHDLAFSLWKP